MKLLAIGTLVAVLACQSLFPSTMTLANAAMLRTNCKLSNAGGCVKYGNNWIEFCPAEGMEQIDPTDGTDNDCISIRPFQFSEFNSAAPTNKYIVKNSRNMAFTPTGGIGREYFSTDCSDVTRPCSLGNSSLSAMRVSVSMVISQTSKIYLDLFIFSEDGTLVYDGNQHSVTAGSFKFDIRSEGYNFVNANCDSVAFDIEMRTLYGKIGSHVVERSAQLTTIDTFVTNPNRYTYTSPGESSPSWSSVYPLFTERSNTPAGGIGTTPVISFEIQAFNPGSSFRVDPFIFVPATVHDNGGAPIASLAATVALGLLVVVLGAF